MNPLSLSHTLHSTILITCNGNNNVPGNALYPEIYLMRYITETLLYISLRCVSRQHTSETLQEMNGGALRWVGVGRIMKAGTNCVFYNLNVF